MRESNNLEFKSTITNTFLKTVSAFSNYNGGQILFGINDDGEIIGIDNPKQACLDIENKINDNIKPLPIYSLDINTKTNVITLDIKEGLYKPYYYKAKAYIRNDSSSIEVDRFELNRLILEGKNMSFEELNSDKNNLTFNILETKLKEVLNIKSFSKDILKTLELYNDDKGYNNAAELFADINDFPGIDSVRVGDSLDILQDRECFEHESILSQYDKIVEKFKAYYEYEEIKGSLRRKVEIIPEKAFREVIANALVHRSWDVRAHINVAMYKNRIEISSPGGLPKGISKEVYINGGISIPRNPIIANIFLRLNIIERFGTGIRRINESYENNELKPIYNIFDDMIQIILPILSNEINLPKDEMKIYKLLSNVALSSTEIAKLADFGKTKTLEILNVLYAKGYIDKIGSGRSTKYHKK